MSNQYQLIIFLLVIFLLTACTDNNSHSASSQSNLPSANANLLPAHIESETTQINGQQLKVGFPCLDMGEMDYFLVTVVGETGYSKAFLKKTETKIEKDENGNPISRMVVEYLAEKDLQTIGNLLVLLEGEVHPVDFQKVAFQKEKTNIKENWPTRDFQKPLAKSLRGDKQGLEKCYGYQWKKEQTTNQTVLYNKADLHGKCQTNSTKIQLEKMTTQSHQDFKLLEGQGTQILYWKDKLVFVSQGEYSEAAAKPVYSFKANGKMNYITFFGVKRKNLYGLLKAEEQDIALDLFANCK